MFTRTAHCPFCANKKHPQHDDLYCVWGHNSRHFIVDYAVIDKPQFGFTPHNFEMLKYDAHTKIVTFQKFCGIGGCGVDIYRQKMKWHFKIMKLQTGTMSLKDWEVLKQVPDLGYHI